MFGRQRKDNPIFVPHFVLFPARIATRQVWESAPGFKINFTTVERGRYRRNAGAVFLFVHIFVHL